EGRAGSERGAQFWNQLSRMRGPAAHCRASRVARQLRPADQLAQSGKEMVRMNRDVEPAVFGGMDPGESAGAGITHDVAPLILRPDKASGLDRQRAAQ